MDIAELNAALESDIEQMEAEDGVEEVNAGPDAEGDLPTYQVTEYEDPDDDEDSSGDEPTELEGEGDTETTPVDGSAEDSPETDDVDAELERLQENSEGWKAARARIKDQNARLKQQGEMISQLQSKSGGGDLLNQLLSVPNDIPEKPVDLDFTDSVLVLKQLAMVRDGEASDFTEAQLVQLLDKVPFEHLNQIRHAAMSNPAQFGDYGADIAELVQQAIPIAVANQGRMQQQRQAYASFAQAQSEAVQHVLSQPGMNDANSEARKEYDQFGNQFAQIIQDRANYPKYIYEFQQMTKKVQAFDEMQNKVAEMENELAEYRKTLGKSVSTPSSGKVPKGKARKMSADQQADAELLNVLRAMG